MMEINNKVSQGAIDYYGNKYYQNVEESPDISAELSGRVSIGLSVLCMSVLALASFTGIAIGNYLNNHQEKSHPQYQQRLPETEAKR